MLGPGGTWTNIPGATSTTLTFTTTAGQSGNQYRAVFSNATPPEAISDPDGEDGARFEYGVPSGFSGGPAPRTRSSEQSKWPSAGCSGTLVSFTRVDAQGSGASEPAAARPSAEGENSM